MKKITLLIIIMIVGVSQLFAARMSPVSGRVVTEKGEAIEYATVVVLRDGQQISGMATDIEGRFTIKAPAGEYTLSIQYLGFDAINEPLKLTTQSDLGDFTLKASATAIDGVVVKAQIIRREADRFVVDVANMPSAIGSDGIELLERAPGVWIDNEKITINGKSGSKVYINDRELRMEPAQLLTYLRTLRAEEIQTIEVVPIVGADYDADASGGAIRITLRKRRENGMTGSAVLRTEQSELISSWNPGFNINVHSGRLDYYASAWAYMGKSTNLSDEQTQYLTHDAGLTSHSNMQDKNRNFGGKAGAVYEISKRHSVGLEMEYTQQHTPGENISATDFIAAGALTRTDSRYKTRDNGNNFSTSFNYIWKIDTLGSTLKFLADYTRRDDSTDNDNFSRVVGVTSRDSLYRSDTHNLYNILAATIAYEKRFSPKWSLKAGAKYTYNDMGNDALYEYEKLGSWIRNDRQSFQINYTENIVAAYAIGTYKHKRLSVVAGLRGEYTRTHGRGSDVSQSYVSLFPNVNVSYSLSKDGAYSIIAQYARSIERPSFWKLSPRRVQISDYTYQTGNPLLQAAFKQDVSMTFVAKHKYTLTAGVVLRQGETQQVMMTDAEDPNVLNLTWVNYDRTKAYYISANLPFQFTKWWSLNANVRYMHNGQRVSAAEEEKFYNFLFLNASTTFTLPAKFFIDISYNRHSVLTIGNISVAAENGLTAGLKKRFGDRFTASFTVRSILNERQSIMSVGEGFTRNMQMDMPWNARSFHIGFTYNFKSGKAFKSKSVEGSSAEEKSRL